MATVSTVPARRREGPSGRRPTGGFGRRRGPVGPGERLVTFRRVVRGVGKTSIAAGVLIFLFVAFELWGTGIAERRDQKALKNQFSRSLAVPPTVAGGAPTSAPPDTEPPALGDAVAEITAPRIGLDKFVVEGVGTEDLKKGPGHYPDTPMPGQHGNVAIAGHRTTYGAPFNRLDELEKGDPITVRTPTGTFRYEVSESKVVAPTEVSVLDPTPDDRLTLTTCNPKYSAAQRLIVVATLASPVAPARPAPAATDTAPRPRPQLAGLSGAPTSKGPAIAWGALAALIWAAAWWLARSWRRWPAYLIATPVFLLVLFVFFENFSRLLPANV
ncbi:MAG: class E sortase [Acidimicrobiales bacterium]